MTTTTQLAFTYLVEGQGSPEVTINEALGKLDAAVHLSVINNTTTAPPGSPTEGDRYIIAATATGDWAGLEDQVAVYISGWIYFTPTVGWHAWDVALNHELLYTGSAWQGKTSDLAVTADATQTQASGYAVATELVQVTTCASTNDSVTLPKVFVGRRCTLFNQAGNTVKLFPFLGDEIANLGANVGLNLVASGTRHLVGIAATRWCVQ